SAGASVTGDGNTAVGTEAADFLATGDYNVALGYRAGLNTATGSHNIFIGDFAGQNITAGSNNIDIGNIGVANDSGIIRIGTVGTHTATYLAGTVHADDGISVNQGGSAFAVAPRPGNTGFGNLFIGTSAGMAN